EHEDDAEDHPLVLRRLELGRQIGQVEPENRDAGVLQFLSQSEKPLRTWRFRTVTAMAPRTAPGIDPMPPRITIERTPIDSRKVNDSGLMKSCLAEKTTPMTPANEAPHAKAGSFARTSGTPMAWAATSS